MIFIKLKTRAGHSRQLPRQREWKHYSRKNCCLLYDGYTRKSWLLLWERLDIFRSFGLAVDLYHPDGQTPDNFFYICTYDTISFTTFYIWNNLFLLLLNMIQYNIFFYFLQLLHFIKLLFTYYTIYFYNILHIIQYLFKKIRIVRVIQCVASLACVRYA